MKDKIKNDEKRNGIYKVKCDYCEIIYIGHTGKCQQKLPETAL